MCRHRQSLVCHTGKQASHIVGTGAFLGAVHAFTLF
nr:MAG TPA_asm: hypothetical protein [Caudoviricetes sp.]